jgi:ATP-dependent DNA ligase
VVAKKLDAPYRSGPSKAWIKVKNLKAPAVSFGVVGCTFVRAFDKFPLMSQWRTDQHNFRLGLLRRRIRSRSHSRALDKFPLKILWRIHR